MGWSDITPSSNIFDIAVFFFSSLVTGPSFKSVSLLVLELWQFSSIKGWLEIWKSKISLSEFCPIAGDWGKLVIPNLSRMSLMKCYWMLQNAWFTAFTVSELLRENYQGLVKLPPVHSSSWKFSLHFIHIFRADWMFSDKFGSSDLGFSRSILIPVYVQAQIAVIH